MYYTITAITASMTSTATSSIGRSIIGSMIACHSSVRERREKGIFKVEIRIFLGLIETSVDLEYLCVYTHI